MDMPIVIDKQKPQSLQDQLCEQLRRFIEDGVLAAGGQVPTSRILARRLGLSRNTVMLAYERLIAEGYLITRLASGTFVADRLGEDAGHRQPANCNGRRGEEAEPADVDFGLRAVDPALFPLREWRRHLLSVLDHHDGGLCRPPSPAGEPRLRRAIVRWLAGHRQIDCDEDDVVIVTGGMQACDLVARTLLQAGDSVVVEAPSHPRALQTFTAAGGRLCPVPVDADGLMVEKLPAQARLAYVTPSHQYPVGGTLPLDRREALLKWAAAGGTFILEDDVGCEFHHDGWQPPALRRLDRHELVIYFGSFRLTMGAGLRLGYVVFPPRLRARALATKSMMDSGCPWLEQATLAVMMDAGSFGRHVARLHGEMTQRRDRLVAGLRARFGAGQLVGSEAGVHLGWVLPEILPAGAACRVAAAGRDLRVHLPQPSPVDGACDPRYREHTLYFGYGGVEIERIDGALDRLQSAIAGL